MKRLSLMVLALGACGAPTAPDPTAVSSSPLAGTVGGQPWRAVGAVASARRAFTDDGGERWIDVSDKVISCAEFLPEAQVIGVVPWQVGAYALSLRRNLTFVVHQSDGGLDNLVATSGRVEVVTAPGADAGIATLRIRARFDAENTVEGEVTVSVCD